MGMPSRPRMLGPRLDFPQEALARVSTGGPADHLLKASLRGDDLVLRLDYPLSDPPEPDEPSDVLRLLVNGGLVGDIIDLKPYKPGDTIEVTLYAVDRPLNDTVDRLPASINYRVRYDSGGGNFEDGPTGQGFITDIVRPGLNSLGPLVFADAVVANGITPDTLVDDGSGGSYLPCTVKGYDAAATGDWIFGVIDDVGETAPPLEVVEAQVGNDIELRFPRALLEGFDGAIHGFGCRIEDRAGNQSVVSTSTRLSVRLSGQIVDLRPPVVPGAADGLVTDADAHDNGGVTVRIPGHPSVQAGDTIRLLWNAYVSDAIVVDVSEVGQDPLKTTVAPYAMVYDDWFAMAGDNDINVPATVSYRVERGGNLIGEPTQATAAPVNLFGAGGKDHDPETPGHDNLRAPVVQAGDNGSGGAPPPPNLIPADALTVDATATIPGSTQDTPPLPAFRSGDRIQFYWNGQAVDNEFVVTAAGVDVVRTIPAAVLGAHSPGTWNVHYVATRTLATTPFTNASLSPTRVVAVKDSTGLPGEGLPLAEAKWVEGPADPGLPDQIDYDKALSDGGTPARIYSYLNMAERDAVTIVFQGYDSITPPGTPVEGSSYTVVYEVREEDLIPKRDDTVDPPVDAIYVDFVIPTDKLLPISFGRATFDYTVKNDAGSTKALQSAIYVSVRPPGESGPIGQTRMRVNAGTQMWAWVKSFARNITTRLIRKH